MTPPQFHLRRAVASDLDAVFTLERATEYAPHWPLSAYAAILDPTDTGAPSTAVGAPFIPRSLRNGWETATQRCLFVAQKDDVLAGFAAGMLHAVATERVAELESVVVAANARRAGIGSALCRAVVDWCRAHGATEVVLEVRANSSAAIALYTGLGFTPTTRRPRYYREPVDDALLLRLQWSDGGRTNN